MYKQIRLLHVRYIYMHVPFIELSETHTPPEAPCYSNYQCVDNKASGYVTTSWQASNPQQQFLSQFHHTASWQGAG